jgi:DNA-binding HxlR family transcriptional regulator
MEHRLVETSKKVLCLLYDKSLHVNEIIRQTSPDRTHVISVIKALERAHLITQNKDKEHGQKKIKQLTDVGYELVDILKSLEQWKKSYFELRKAYKEKFKVDSKLSDHTIISILKNRGLTDEEINVYEDIIAGVSLILYFSEKNIMNTIFCRYIFRLSKISLSDIANNILYDVIRDAAVFQISLIAERTKQHKGSFEMAEGAQDLLWDIREELVCPVPQIIHNQIKDAVTSHISLLKPAKKHVEALRPTIKGDNNLSSPKIALDICEGYINKLPN